MEGEEKENLKCFDNLYKAVRVRGGKEGGQQPLHRKVIIHSRHATTSGSTANSVVSAATAAVCNTTGIVSACYR